MASLIRKVLVFVDWDCSRRVVPIAGKKRPERHIDEVFSAISGSIAAYLHGRSPQKRHEVRWRLYHGWHEGVTPTIDRRDLEGYQSTLRSRQIGKVVFTSDIAYSDLLLCDSRRKPLRYTVRHDRGFAEQKMVDTALSVDVLHARRASLADDLIVVADDDDYIPLAYTAEMWKADIVFFRREIPSSRAGDLSGMTYVWSTRNA